MHGSLVEPLGATRDAEVPTFVARKGVLSREYHVVVSWPDGRRLKVGRFVRRPDARRWIENKSIEWLAEYRATGDANDEGFYLVALKGVTAKRAMA